MMKLVLIAAFLLLLCGGWRLWRSSASARFIENFPFAERLDKRLAARHPELDAAQRAMVLEGLRDYFLLCNKAGRRMLAMPSQAVDDAWHEFILFTRQYDNFCRRAFGRFLHHTPAEAMATPRMADLNIKRSWRLACAHEGIDPKAPSRLPRLFAIDASLSIAGGFIYQLDCADSQHSATGRSFCASHIGCSSGCSGGTGSDTGSHSGGGMSDSGSGDGGGGCGGD